MTPSIWQIKEAIATHIATGDPLAVVLPKRIPEVIQGKNLNVIRSVSDENRIHGWMVGDPAEDNVRIKSVNPMDPATAPDTSWTQDSTLTFPIWGFHWYALGDENAGTDSTKLFSDIRESVVDVLARYPRLGLAGDLCAGTNQILRHFELQVIDPPGVVALGSSEMAHWANCELTVKLTRRPAA